MCWLIPGGGYHLSLGSASTIHCCRFVDRPPHHVYAVLPFPTSCLNCARNGSKSDRKNRILRPITRRWGICFRSTQRYTVCWLTPRKHAASLTLMGRFRTVSLGGVSTLENRS